MASVPNKIEKFDQLENDLSTSVSVALWRKAANLAEYINKSRPIGMLMYFHNTQDLLAETVPDAKYWKRADGTAVNNTLSPMHGVVIPEMRLRFVKHPADGHIVFGTAGADTKNISHNHGGFTHYAWPGGAFNADNDDERAGPFTHRHSIFHGGSGAASTVPPYRELAIYVRIL